MSEVTAIAEAGDSVQDVLNRGMENIQLSEVCEILLGLSLGVCQDFFKFFNKKLFFKLFRLPQRPMKCEAVIA